MYKNGSFFISLILFVQAGILDNQLLLELEPEAASLYCYKTIDGNPLFETVFFPKSKYLVLDAGGSNIFLLYLKKLCDG